jgi:hypothetical protein
MVTLLCPIGPANVIAGVRLPNCHGAYDTGESSERCVLQELLSSLELEGVLIQADALHTTRPFFSGAWSRGPTCS